MAAVQLVGVSLAAAAAAWLAAAVVMMGGGSVDACDGGNMEVWKCSEAPGGRWCVLAHGVWRRGIAGREVSVYAQSPGNTTCSLLQWM